jgi:hypothetical protein
MEIPMNMESLKEKEFFVEWLLLDNGVSTMSAYTKGDYGLLV